MTQHSFTLEEISSLLKAELQGKKEHSITGVADITTAQKNDITFLAHPRYLSHLETTNAGAILIGPSITPPPEKNVLITEDPSVSFQVIIEAFHKKNHTEKSAFSKIHPTATIADTVKLGNNVTIGPHVSIDNGTSIGDNTRIEAGCSIGIGVQIENDCHLYPRVIIREYCSIGNRVIIHPGTIIGDCGFGYTQNEKGEHQKIKQLGSVRIEDDVEIKSNCCIDRARFTTTRIGQGTKIDNLVYVGHGVQIGKHCIIVGQTGIAGSTIIGDHVMIGGQVAIDGHLTICSKTMIAATAGVTKSIVKPGVYGGIPAISWKDFKKQVANIKRTSSFHERLLALEEKLKD